MDQTMTGGAVEKIADLAKHASGYEVIHLPMTKELAANGLPAEIPLLFDKRPIEHGGVGLTELRTQVERWRLHPERRRGVAKVSTLSAFIDLVNRHKVETSAIFAKTTFPEPSLTAVIDYHAKGDGAPNWCQHKVVYGFPVTDEFAAWTKGDGIPMGQGEFAAFIEDRIIELAAPLAEEVTQVKNTFLTSAATPAELMQLSRGLQVQVSARVAGATVLQSGEGQIVFEEEHKTSVTVPGAFVVSVPVFLDGEPVRFLSRLRYRVREGKVVWFYQLYRWRELIRERVVNDLDFASSETDLPSYEGLPEA